MDVSLNTPSVPEAQTSTIFQTSMDASVNTMIDLDLDYQLHAVTDKSISLGKTLAELKTNNNDDDFHTQILKTELNKYKTDNLTLLGVIEALENDNKLLAERITKLESESKIILNPLGSSITKPNHCNTFQVQRQPPKVQERRESVNKSKLIILADSHGKYLGNLVEQKSSVNDVEQLAGKLTHNDHLLIIAGTNNIQNTNINRLTDGIDKLINNTQHTNLILSTIPIKYDQPNLDLKISTVNSKIEEIVVKLPNLKLLPLHLLPKHLYASDRIHFNKKGKGRIAELVSKLLHTNKGHLKKKTVLTTKDASASRSSVLETAITVVEDNMSKIFEQYKNNTTVGLAHTVSRDFHMSAGVAVKFRDKFGRPCESDLIYKNLAHQKINNGPSEVYWGKPTKEDYNEAFRQIELDFQTKNLKIFVCSAMGCVRDLIQPHHFVENIAKFQKATGAKVYVVSYDQTARRKLWSGLTHNEFVRLLRNLIAAAQLQPQEDSIAVQETLQEDQSTRSDTYTSTTSVELQSPAALSGCANSVVQCENGHSVIESATQENSVQEE
ncbi:hypothetical protein J6590_061730, partial [Homalodisca vitripennis]